MKDHIENKIEELLIKVSYHTNKNDTSEIMERKIRNIFLEAIEFGQQLKTNEVREKIEKLHTQHQFNYDKSIGPEMVRLSDVLELLSENTN